MFGSSSAVGYGDVVSPLLIVGLVVVAVIVLVFLFGLTPDPSRRRAPRILKRRSRYLRFLPFLPLLGAVGCLVLAFTGFRFSVQETSPVAILVMDVSRSMDATDVAPSRLAAAQTAARSFLGELPPDFQVGLVTFAGDEELAVAPTTDHDVRADLPACRVSLLRRRNSPAAVDLGDPLAPAGGNARSAAGASVERRQGTSASSAFSRAVVGATSPVLHQ